MLRRLSACCLSSSYLLSPTFRANPQRRSLSSTLNWIVAQYCAFSSNHSGSNSGNAIVYRQLWMEESAQRLTEHSTLVLNGGTVMALTLAGQVNVSMWTSAVSIAAISSISSTLHTFACCRRVRSPPVRHQSLRSFSSLGWRQMPVCVCQCLQASAKHHRQTQIWRGTSELSLHTKIASIRELVCLSNIAPIALTLAYTAHTAHTHTHTDTCLSVWVLLLCKRNRNEPYATHWWACSSLLHLLPFTADL